MPDGITVLDARGAFTRVLRELKTFHQSRHNYPASILNEHGAAVERRARKINPELKSNANRGDVKYNGWDRDAEQWGPLRTRLEEFGHVLEFVVGPRESISNDLRKFITKISILGAERQWRHMGARSLKEAAGVIKARVLRHIGITAVIREEYLRHDRLGRALGDDKAASSRRKSAKAMHRSWADEFGQRNGPSTKGCAYGT